VQVQQGCDHRCTFCIIPYGRGNSRSVPLGEVVRQVRALVAQGTAEVVLTGVDITSYGADLPGRPALGQMLRRLLAQVPDLRRLRLSSLDAIELDADLKRLVAEEPRLMPHLHLSLQAGDDMILKRMKRRHSRAEAVALCDELRALRPDIVFGADLIAGFPTETEAMFDNTLKLVEDCGLTWLHVFPYSARKGTPAARMPQLPVALRKERAARLRAAGAAALDRFLEAQHGKSASVLIERRLDDGRRLGRGETFAEVLLPGGAVGDAVAARITGRDGDRLVALPSQHRLSPAA
jgi:threonylcarbamoyladenosine tRNA methylthiotransferase MtaB